jgi:ribosomal protein L33
MRGFSLIILIFVFVSCSTKYPFCIGEQNKKLEIHWGTIYKNQKTTEERFILSSNGQLLAKDSSNVPRKIAKLTEDKYCEVVGKVNQTILKTQAINEVGDTLNFVEYINPSLGIYFAAKWHPRFKTKNSVLFRELFEYLKMLTLDRKS